MVHNNHNSKMMWMMMICCLAPVFLIFLFGSGAKTLGAPVWIVVGLVAVFVIAHFVSMKKSHQHTDDEPAKRDDTAKQPDSHSNHSNRH